MSRSELFAVMVLAMSTISGAILILYAQTLSHTVPDAVGHMIAASLISLARRLAAGAASWCRANPQPQDEIREPGLKYDSSIDAIVRGTMDGMQLFLAVIAIIIVIFALVALADQILSMLPLSMAPR